MRRCLYCLMSIIVYSSCATPQHLPGVGSADFRSIGLEDLCALAESRSLSVGSFSFECEIKFHRYVSQPPEMVDCPPQLQYQAESYKAEGDKRAYSRSYGADESDIVMSSSETWNGENYKCYVPKDNRGTVYGLIERNHGWHNNKFEVQATPYDAVLLPILGDSTHKINKSIANLLRAPGLSILKDLEVIDDSPCVIVANSAGIPILWLDTSRGFVVKQYDTLMSRYGLTKKRLYNERFVEIGPGTWLPETSHIQDFGHGKDGSGEELLTEVSLEYRNISVNQDISDEVFDLRFPPGTRVSDKTAGIEYTVGENTVADAMDARLLEFQNSSQGPRRNAETVSDSATTSEESVSKSDLHKRSISMSGADSEIILIVVLAIVFLLLLATILYRLRRSRI